MGFFTWLVAVAYQPLTTTEILLRLAGNPGSYLFGVRIIAQKSGPLSGILPPPAIRKPCVL